MIRSMTGFGRCRIQTENYAVCAEMRSVNNRGLRISFRLPDRLQGLEPELDKILREHLARGTITLAIVLDDLSGNSGCVLDDAVVRHYHGQLVRLREELGLSGGVTLDVLAGLPGVFRGRTTWEEIPEEINRAVHEAVGGALKGLIGVREQEGAHGWQDILSHCETIGRLVDRVEKKIPKMIEQYRRRVTERLAPLLEEIGSAVSEEDVRREVVLFADRSDISEEIARLRSHLMLMKEMTGAEKPCGRRVEFIAQEMFREANTMASKANDPEVIPHVLDIKSEIEKIREQALNVE